MTARAVAVVVWLAMASGCGYWKARPAGDTAPTAWGDSTAGNDALGTASEATGRQGPGVEERLRNLENLRRDGVIGAGEYRQRREATLRQAFE